MTSLSWLPQSRSPQGGLSPTPPEAREWLTEELHGASYQDPWLSSVIRWVIDHLRSFFESAQNLAGLSPVVTALVGLVVIALLVWVLPRVRREPAVTVSGGAVLEDLTITPGHYRDLAAQALRDGRYDDAALDSFRAIAKDMSSRTLLDDAPGRTAHEVSLSLASPFPEHAGRLGQAADLFDAVRYGHRGATAEQAIQVQRLDAELVATRPQLPESSLLASSRGEVPA